MKKITNTINYVNMESNDSEKGKVEIVQKIKGRLSTP